MIFINCDDLRAKACFEECLNTGLYVSDNISDLKYANVIYLGRSGIDCKNYLFINNETVFVDKNIFNDLQENTLVITLMFNEYLEELSYQYKFEYLALLQDEDFVEKNSILTAEGVIAYLITHRLYPLYNTKILILGYGHCGKKIVECIKGFHSQVDVYSRNQENISNIINDFDDIHFSDYNIIINTIPEVVVKKEQIDEMKKDVLIIDIASYPYGVDHHYALDKGLNSIILASIPNKYAYYYAGLMIFNKIKEKIVC